MSTVPGWTPESLICATRGHFTLGPTGDTTRCLRCLKTLDGLGLDPSLSTNNPDKEPTR